MADEEKSWRTHLTVALLEVTLPAVSFISGARFTNPISGARFAW